MVIVGGGGGDGVNVELGVVVKLKVVDVVDEGVDLAGAVVVDGVVVEVIVEIVVPEV